VGTLNAMYATVDIYDDTISRTDARDTPDARHAQV